MDVYIIYVCIYFNDYNYIQHTMDTIVVHLLLMLSEEGCTNCELERSLFLKTELVYSYSVLEYGCHSAICTLLLNSFVERVLWADLCWSECSLFMWDMGKNRIFPRTQLQIIVHYNAS